MVSASFPWSSPVCISCQWGSGVSSDSLKWDRSHQHMVKIHERPLPECNLCENYFAVLEGLGWTQEERQWDWVGHLERHLAWKWKGLNARILFAQQLWNECKDCGNNFECFQAESFSPGCYRSMCEELNQMRLQDQKMLCDKFFSCSLHLWLSLPSQHCVQCSHLCQGGILQHWFRDYN